MNKKLQRSIKADPEEDKKKMVSDDMEEGMDVFRNDPYYNEMRRRRRAANLKGRRLIANIRQKNIYNSGSLKEIHAEEAARRREYDE